MRRLILVFCVLSALALVAQPLHSEPKSPTMLKSVSDDADQARKEFEKLLVKINSIALKIKETHPQYAEKLNEGAELLRQELVKENIDDLAKILSKTSQDIPIGIVIEKTDEIKNDLESLLALLENRANTKKNEEKLKELEKLANDIKKLSDEQKKLKEDLNKDAKLRDQMSAAKDEMDKIIKEQEDAISKMDDNPNNDLSAKIDREIERLKEQLEKQNDIQKDTNDKTTPSTKSAGDFVDKVEELLKRQTENLNDSANAASAAEKLKEALQELENLSKFQDDINKQTTAADPTKSGELAKKQDSALKTTKKIFSGLKDIKFPSAISNDSDKQIESARKELLKAASGQMDAKNALNDELFNTASESQKETSKALGSAKDILKALSDQYSKDAAQIDSDLSKEQDSIAEDTKNIGKEMAESSSQQANPAVKDTYKKGSDDLDKANASMKKSSERLGQKDPSGAQPHQKQAASTLASTLAELITLQNLLAQANKDDFQKLAETQKNLSSDSSASSGDLQKMAETAPDTAPKDVKDAISKAASSAKSSSENMRKSSESLSRNIPNLANRSQKSAAKDLKDAIDKLNQAKENLGKQGEKSFSDAMKKKEEELANSTQNLADKLSEMSKESASSGKETSKKLSQASSSSSQSSGKMKDSAKQLSSNEPKEGKKSAQEAKEKLAEARKQLDDLLKSPLTEEEKYRLEKLAERQKKLEEEAKKSAEELEAKKQGDPSKNMEKAASNMESSSKSMQSGDSKSSDEEMEKALEEMRRAYENLRDQMDELAQNERKDKLRKLQEELEGFLNAQKSISEQTISLDFKKVKSPEDAFTREDMLKLISLANDESNLASGINEMRLALEDEDATVYPFQMAAIADEMMFVKSLLGEGSFRTDAVTQEAEMEIEYELQQLIESLKKERSKKQAKPFGGGGGGGGQMKMPLVPKIAELKLLKQMQSDVKNKTDRISQQIKANTQPDPVYKNILSRLASEQVNLARLTESLTKKIEEEMKEMQGGGDDK